MTLEDQMKLSVLMGIPLNDLVDKAEDFIGKIHELVLRETDGPRIALILMAMAYLYHVKLAVEEGSNLLEEATKAIFVATELLSHSLQQEDTP